MNNRMSYNDVQQLKNVIRQRLAEASAELGNANPNSRMARANNMAARSMNQQGYPQMQSQPMATQTMQSQSMRPQQAGQQQPKQGAMSQSVKRKSQAANNAPSPLNKTAADMKQKSEHPQAGAYFHKYDCGHKYPKMTVRQHLKDDMRKSHSERVENLRYAFLMSEILSEPVCKRRKRR